MGMVERAQTFFKFMRQRWQSMRKKHGLSQERRKLSLYEVCTIKHLNIFIYCTAVQYHSRSSNHYIHVTILHGKTWTTGQHTCLNVSFLKDIYNNTEVHVPLASLNKKILICRTMVHGTFCFLTFCKTSWACCQLSVL